MASFTLETAHQGQARQFQFDAPNVSIGRDKAADFTLDHPTVSRQHAVVSWDGHAYVLKILSRGGLTAIDGQQVGGEVRLYDGSQLMFGQLAFVFRSPHAPPKPANAYAPAQQGAQQPTYGNGGQYPVASTTGMHHSPSGIYQAPGQAPRQGATMEMATMSRSGAFPSMAEHEKLARSQAAQSSDGLMSWEEIAATADDAPEEKDALTDFHRMQKEQEKFEKENRGTNPAFIIVGIIAVGLVAMLFIYGPTDVGGGGGPGDGGPKPIDQTIPILTLRPGDADCIGAAQCREAAMNAFEVGKITLERAEADIINLNEGYKQLVTAEKLLEKGNIIEPPSEMRNLGDIKVRAAEAMKDRFIRLRARYFAEEDRSEYEKMAKTLNEIQAYYPDERLNYYRWAQREILKMKEDGNYPRDTQFGEP